MLFQGTHVPVTRPSAQADWQSQAACRDHNPDLFFPSEDAPAELVRVQEATAKAVCRSCPVAGVCLSTALSRRLSYGVWGGLSAEDRKAVLATRSATLPAPAAETAPIPRVRGRRRIRRVSSAGIVRGTPVAITAQPVAVSV